MHYVQGQGGGLGYLTKAKQSEAKAKAKDPHRTPCPPFAEPSDCVGGETDLCQCVGLVRSITTDRPRRSAVRVSWTQRWRDPSVSWLMVLQPSRSKRSVRVDFPEHWDPTRITMRLWVGEGSGVGRCSSGHLGAPSLPLVRGCAEGAVGNRPVGRSVRVRLCTLTFHGYARLLSMAMHAYFPWLCTLTFHGYARLLSMAMHAYAPLHPNTPHACVRLGLGTQRWTSCIVMHRFSAEKKLVLVEFLFKSTVCRKGT